jgi:hypothetical protein
MRVWNAFCVLLLCLPFWQKTTLAAAGDSKVAECEYPYALVIEALRGQELVRLPNGMRILLPHRWITPQNSPTKASLARTIKKIRSTVPVAPLAHLMNADLPLPDDADQATMFKDLHYPDEQGLILFGKSGCFIEAAIINRYGLFTTSPAHFIIVPNQFVLPPRR